jgi:hypothetical protein
MTRQARQWTLEQLESLLDYTLARMHRRENLYAGKDEEGGWVRIPWSTRHYMAIHVKMMIYRSF